MRKALTTFSITALLASCSYGKQSFETVVVDENWQNKDLGNLNQVDEVDNLKNWWSKLDDKDLHKLIEIALVDSPDLKIANARISEARGIRKTNKSFLFPQISASANIGREKSAFSGIVADASEARFDASYEIDIWGKNRDNLASSDFAVLGLEENYKSAELIIIAEIARAYVEYREFEKQENIAMKNLKIQERTLELVKKRYEIGESPKLDVDRSESLVNTTRASIPEFGRVKNNKRLELTVLTGVIPSAISLVLNDRNNVPEFSSEPILLSPANVIANRPDVKFASLNLASKTKIAQSVTATLFPSLTLSGFYGIADNAFATSDTIWNMAIGTAVNLIDFERIEGRIDSARASEVKAFEEYRKAILSAVTDVEMALNDYSKINERQISLNKAYKNALSAYETSNRLYKEGEISFIDVLDSERTLNAADSALIEAQSAKTKSIIRLYKALGVR